MNKDLILEINNLRTQLYSESGVVKAIDGLDLKIPKGKVVGLLGESGCGKTMTALSILKILPPVAKIISGTIKFNNIDLLKLGEKELENFRGREISIIFQEPSSSLNPVIKVGSQIQDAISTHQRLAKKELMARIYQLLEKVNLNPAERFFPSYPHQLSGGERQRIMIALAISMNPKLLIADEPTSALDVSIQSELLKLLLKLKEEMNLAILFITHDLRLINQIADFVYVMYLGQIVEEANKNEIFSRPLHPYTKGLLESLPNAKSKGLPLLAIKGLPADMHHIPSGCPFHPRCPIAELRCKTAVQELTLKTEGRKVRCWKACF